MPITTPPPAVIRQYLGATTRHTRRVEIYEADGETRWGKDKVVRLKGGSVSVDYDRSERRVLDNLVLDNSDDVLKNAPNEFWYDKIIKVYRGINVREPVRLPKILIISDKTGENIAAPALKDALTDLGYGDVRINTLADSVFDLIGYDIIVSISATAPASIQLVKDALGLGYPVVSFSEVSYARYGTLVSPTNTGNFQIAFTSASPLPITHPLASGWSTISVPITGQGSIATPKAGVPLAEGTTVLSTGISDLINAAIVEREGFKWSYWSQHISADLFANTQFRNYLLGVFNYMNPVVPITHWECQIGEFMIDTISEAHFPHEVIITGRDYTKKCLLSKYAQATQFNKGQKLEDLIAAIAGAAGISKRILPATGLVVARDFFFERGTTRWDAMKELATAYDYELYFDATGYLVMRKYNDPATTPPVLTILTGPAGNLAAYNKSTNDSRIYNHMLVTGESSDETIPPVYAVAKNENPDSPTSIARLGERSYEYSSAFIETTAQATEVANSFLAVHSLEEFELTFDSLMFPWLEVGDIIGWVDPRPAPGDPRTFLLSTLNFPLELGAMAGTAKRVTNVGSL